jgi:galactose mutarotase-like enzyme
LIVLENEAIRLACEPACGARVTSLVDRRTGREWLVPGTLPRAEDAWAAEGAVFGGAEAFGWDECLPTVAPCPDPLDANVSTLRDHGEQWGRPAEVEATDDGLVAQWPTARWPLRFERTLRLQGATVVCAYELEAAGDRPLPILWSMHALLALDPGSRIVLEPGSESHVVRGVEARHAAKLYMDARPMTRVAAQATDGSELRFEWDRRFAPALGIWLDYGGWPPGESRHQVAIEPTTSPDDDLGSAIAAGTARILEPGMAVRWEVRLKLVTGSRAP